MIRECVICGGAFESRQNRKTCSDACHAENRRRHQTEAYYRREQEQAAQRARGTAAGRALAGVNAAALAAHVSYGQYVAILKDAASRHLPPQEIEAKLQGAARW